MHLRARLSVTAPSPGVEVIGLSGHLDAPSGVRLLRLWDTRSAPAGRTSIRHLTVDLTGMVTADLGGLRGLDRLRQVVQLHGVGFALAGDAGVQGRLPRRALQLLAGVPRFPNVDAATATVPLTGHVGV